MFRKFVVLPIIFVLLVFTFATLNVGTVHAASCSGNGCNGRDPAQTGCSSGATTILSAPIKNGTQTLGFVNLRWSATCQTNWAQVVSNGSARQMQAIIQRDSGSDGGPQLFCFPINCADFISATSIFTDMVYAPHNAAMATGIIAVGVNRTFVGCVVNPNPNPDFQC